MCLSNCRVYPSFSDDFFLLLFFLLTFAGNEDEFPKKPLGQLPPQLTTAAAGVSANHVANGQSHTEPADPPEELRSMPEGCDESRPPSRPRSDSLDKPLGQPVTDERDARSRESGEISHMRQKASPPERQGTSVSVMNDRAKPPSNATANHNSNAVLSAQRDIAPRWYKPSETKLEAAKAAAARDVQRSRTASPVPSSPDDAGLSHKRPRSRGFVPGSNRGSNASQYDNVPGLLEQNFEILDLERPPSRMRTPRSGTPHSMSSLQQSSPTHGPRYPVPPQYFHSSPAGGGVNQFQSPPRQPSPNRGKTEVPIFHAVYGMNVDHDRLYVPPPRIGYATTQHRSGRYSPEKPLMNNSFATYRRQAAQPQTARHPQAYAAMDGRFDGPPEVIPQHQHYSQSQQVVDNVIWTSEDRRPTLQPMSPSEMPRSPSFQQAQMSPLEQFTFPADANALLSYRMQLQERQAIVRQQLPQVFREPHYRHAPEAFTMQDSMLL